MPNLGPTELLIILFLVIALFGGKRLFRGAGELGKSVREFGRAVGEDEPDL
ncbi:MAG: twin-arginine translocase TatA/TatE family subunit [Anaerolineae bacterium]|nr:twin-arginine translocase TatA/TatE family subunit [Anaerolineae bacterium]